MEAQLITCAGCGEPLDIEEGMHIVGCKYCGNKNVIPKLLSKDKMALYDVAMKARRNCEFDRAYRLFEGLLKDFPSDPELHWSMAMCNYGIKIEKDPYTGRLVPTINKMNATPFTNDSSYQSALDFADEDARKIYKDIAREINEIYKEYNNLADNVEKFDIFISFKDLDESGSRTKDSHLAETLYKNLTDHGFNVFYSRITMNKYPGKKFEPIIYSALNSSKAMIVVGTKSEYINATWVKNEWSRFLKQDLSEKLIIPAYDKNIDVFPDELLNYQAFDISDNNGIDKLINRLKQAITKSNIYVSNKEDTVNVANLVARAKNELEYGNFDKAMELSEMILNQDYVNEYALLIRLMITCKAKKFEDLEMYDKPLEIHPEFSKYKQVSKDSVKINRLNEFNNNIKEKLRLKEEERKKNAEYRLRREREIKAEYDKKLEIYNSGKRVAENAHTIAKLKKSISILNEVPDFENTGELINDCKKRISSIQKRYATCAIYGIFALVLFIIGLIDSKMIGFLSMLLAITCVTISVILLTRLMTKSKKALLLPALVFVFLTAVYIGSLLSKELVTEMAERQMWVGTAYKMAEWAFMAPILCVLIAPILFFGLRKFSSLGVVPRLVVSAVGCYLSFYILAIVLMIISAYLENISAVTFVKYFSQMFKMFV